MSRHEHTKPLTSDEQDFVKVFDRLVAERADEEGWFPQTRNVCARYIASITTGDGSTPRGMTPYHQMVVQNIFRQLCDNRPDMNKRFPGQFMSWFGGQ